MVEEGEEAPKDLAEEEDQVSSENSSGIAQEIEGSTDSKEEQVLHSMEDGEEDLLGHLLPPVHPPHGEVGQGEPGGEEEVQETLLHPAQRDPGKPHHNHQVEDQEQQQELGVGPNFPGHGGKGWWEVVCEDLVDPDHIKQCCHILWDMLGRKV